MVVGHAGRVTPWIFGLGYSNNNPENPRVPFNKFIVSIFRIRVFIGNIPQWENCVLLPANLFLCFVIISPPFEKTGSEAAEVAGYTPI
jgi:hypothetical protein